MRLLFLFSLLILLAGRGKASVSGVRYLHMDTMVVNVNTIELDSVPSKEFKKKKFVSALFSFPFPFGFMGAHRVMLGTKPWIPVVYAATFGGCFGILPLIDFCVISFSKDLAQYENNPQLFMWVKPNE